MSSGRTLRRAFLICASCSSMSIEHGTAYGIGGTAFLDALRSGIRARPSVSAPRGRARGGAAIGFRTEFLMSVSPRPPLGKPSNVTFLRQYSQTEEAWRNSSLRHRMSFVKPSEATTRP